MGEIALANAPDGFSKQSLAVVKLDARPVADAADALAVALSHAHAGPTMQRLTGSNGNRPL